jgi:NAD(P)-dependent dehydrogenase (short-subunit alcohol dehydrogenase family)
MAMNELQGKVAVVTGGASGIGRAVVDCCVAEGMKVVVADVEEGALAKAADELRTAGADVLAVRTDVSRPEDVDRLARQTVDHFGAVHVVHNNAGVATGGPIWQNTIADWKWVLGVNLWGVINGVRSFVPIMLEQGGHAHIVNTASAAGLTSPPFLGAYTVTKHAVVALSESLARDLALQQADIRVSVLCPGFVNTSIFESHRNRPADLQNAEDPAAGAMTGSSSLLAGTMEPSVVAGHVIDAVKNDRFYILPHPEVADGVRSRMEDILQNRYPALGKMF